ncbi:ABC transporter permease [Corynebacterium aquatimens]|uniref:energy-coupling factor transporter transmembrane component T n=1 Tax=Corynebacterium aquatimens TaxID=1190508 RepID=UPI0025402FAF|nr:energy-coupling factor transporter transmembrane component T [Corynebacterium aquatimens]QYH19917.1 ABC transporter permease [Corynebacterium aquatimens]
MVNPLTALAVGASGWILVMGINTPQASAAIVLISLVIATAKTKNLAPAIAVFALALPVALSMLLIHAPYGEERIAPLITADGLLVAGELALRFTALMACLLAAGTFVRTPDLAKALQALPGGNRISYIAGSTLQLFPQGTQRVRIARDANRLKHRDIRFSTVIPNLIMPVLTELLTLSSHRGRALETAGYDLPGRRTVLRPVPDSALQRTVRWATL